MKRSVNAYDRPNIFIVDTGFVSGIPIQPFVFACIWTFSIYQMRVHKVTTLAAEMMVLIMSLFLIHSKSLLNLDYILLILDCNLFCFPQENTLGVCYHLYSD